MILYQKDYEHKNIKLDTRILEYFKFVILEISSDFIGYYKGKKEVNSATEIIRMVETDDRKILKFKNQINEMVRVLYKSEDNSPENFYAENCGNAIRSYLKYCETHNPDTVMDLEDTYESICRFKLKIRRNITTGLDRTKALELNDEEYLEKIEKMKARRNF